MSGRWEIVVVGAGPAGLTAALEARRLGAEVLLLDEHVRAGGQYFMQPIQPGSAAAFSQSEAGHRLIEEVRSAGVKIWSGAEVWGLFPERLLTVLHEGASREIIAERLILAAGAHDRTMAFPGWTLPGVFTPGGLQRLIKAEGVTPGRRAVVAGCGPFLLVVARQLLAAGVELAAYVDSTHPSLAIAAGVLRFPETWGELAGYIGALLRHRVPVHLGAKVTMASGNDILKRVTIAAPGRTFEVEADLLAIAQGFRPSVELSVLAGCAHRYKEDEGGRVCLVERETGETSVRGVFAAGEMTGVAGWRPAVEEGRIAGLSAARSLDRWSAEAERCLKRARRRRRRAQALANFVNHHFAPPANLVEIVTDDTLVCRCEDVTGRDICEAIESGARTAGAIKMWTRCAMGPCQGRICSWSLAHYAARRLGVTTEEIGVNEPRVPIKPVALSATVNATNTDGSL